MGAKTIIIKDWPPMMKVSGTYIKALFEIETTEIIKKKLDKKGVPYGEYVKTEYCIDALTEGKVSEPFVTYNAKSKLSDKL